MCGQAKFNLIISVTSAHFWPLRDRENSDALFGAVFHSCCIKTLGTLEEVALN